MKTDKQRQQGHILILNQVYVLRILEKTELEKIPTKTGIGGLYAFNTST